MKTTLTQRNDHIFPRTFHKRIREKWKWEKFLEKVYKQVYYFRTGQFTTANFDYIVENAPPMRY